MNTIARPTRRRLASALIVLSSLVAGSWAADALKRPGTNAVAAKVELKAGQVVSRKSEGPTHIQYHVAVPDDYSPSNPPPLLVMFDPGGNGKGIMERVRASANKVGWMVVGADQLNNNTPEDQEKALHTDLMTDVRQYLNYNQKCLFYGGFSGGALRAYCLTAVQKDPCAGILAFGGWLGGKEREKLAFQKNMAVAVVNGDNDKNAVAWEDADRKTLKRRGCDIKYFHFPGGHEIGPPKTIDQAISWLDSQKVVKKKVSAP